MDLETTRQSLEKYMNIIRCRANQGIATVTADGSNRLDMLETDVMKLEAETEGWITSAVELLKNNQHDEFMRVVHANLPPFLQAR
jgi:ATP-dependent protease HslVU (ClpYQ) peptidase subunit